MANTFHTLTVDAIDRLTDDAVKVSLAVPAKLQPLFAFVPGQYLTLRTSIDGQDIRRAYSICSTPEDASLSVGIREVEDGRFSGFSNRQLRVGDTLQVMPAQGRFVVDADPVSQGRYLAIAAGSGITPVLSIVRNLLEQTSARFVTLVYGNKRIESIMFRQTLDDLKDRYLQRFRLIHCITRETQDIDLYNGRIDSAKIQALTDAGLIDPAACDQVLICGPSAMTDLASQTCQQLGVGADRVKTERFTPADDVVVRAPSQAVQQAVADGVDVTVVIDGSKRQFIHSDPQLSLLEAARQAGIELPFSCAGGMCATCRCKLVHGDGEMAVNYSLEPWELEAGYMLACQTRPKSDTIVIDFDAV